MTYVKAVLEFPGARRAILPPLTDPERRKHYFTALNQWAVTGYVILKPSAAPRLLEELSKYGLTFRGLCQLLATHRDEVKEIPERRSGYEHEFHYDLTLAMPDGRELYVETVLDIERDPLDSRIVVVSIHEAN